MTNWIRYRRKGGATPDPTPLLTIRSNAIALNAHFVATAKLEEKSHVCIFSDPEGFRLALSFHDKAVDDDAIALTSDGGAGVRGGGGRCIQVTGLMREQPWLAAVARIEDPRLRRFEPKWVSADSRWVISLCPSFEHRVSDRSEIPTRTCGIYRYLRGDEIVYIGRGQIRSRVGSRGREEWDFETIEYSIVSNEEDQIKWEAFWLDRFAERHAKLPLYNRILGARRSELNNGREATSPHGGVAISPDGLGADSGPLPVS